MTKADFEKALRVAKRDSHQVRKSALFDAPDAVFVPSEPLDQVPSSDLPSSSVELVQSYHWTEVVRQDAAVEVKATPKTISRKRIRSIYCGTGCEVCASDLAGDRTIISDSTISTNTISKTAAASSLTVSSALTRTMTTSTTTSTTLALNNPVGFWPSGTVHYTALDILTGVDSSHGYTHHAELAHTSNGLVDRALAARLAPIERSLDPWHSALTGSTMAWHAEMQGVYRLVETGTRHPNDGSALGRAYCGLRIGGAPFASELKKKGKKKGKKQGRRVRPVQK